jgi:hypothetical protein
LEQEHAFLLLHTPHLNPMHLQSLLQDPEGLEQRYRKDRSAFRREFPQAVEGMDSELIRFWRLRLAPDAESVPLDRGALLTVMALALLTGTALKIPGFFGLEQEQFFARNLAVLLGNGMILYLILKHRPQGLAKPLGYAALMVGLLAYLNLLPAPMGDSVQLSLIHVPLFLWCVLGWAWAGFEQRDMQKRIAFIRFNGEYLIMAGLLLLAAALFTAVTFGLFQAIGISINAFFNEYAVFYGGSGLPILALWLIDRYPRITERIAPVIARVFTPLVTLTLGIYLATVFGTGRWTLEDRDTLILFNVMLLAVVAIIAFSVTELEGARSRSLDVLVLLVLAALALLIDGMALSAIIGRVAEGLTPNRFVVLSTNLLIGANLALLAWRLAQAYRDSARLPEVERTMARYLTVYFWWTAAVILLLPVLFGGR